MMFSFVAVASLALLAQAAVVPTDIEARASKKCHTVEKGYFAAFPNGKWKAMGRSKDNHVVYGTKDTQLQVEFQSCPVFTPQSDRLHDWLGRIIVPSVQNKCLTAYQPTTEPAGTYHIKISKCTSDTKPDTSQKWEYGNDFGAVVFWTGTSGFDEIGYTTDQDSLVPQTQNGTHYAKLGCAKTCASFGIKSKSQLGHA